MSVLKDIYEYTEMRFMEVDDDADQIFISDKLQDCLEILWYNLTPEDRAQLQTRKSFRKFKEEL